MNHPSKSFSKAVLALTFFAAAGAFAQVGSRNVSVAVGSTQSVDVGFARGLICDDLSVVSVQLAPGDSASNVLQVTGKKIGKTTCRAGTGNGGPQVTVSITVTPPVQKG